MAEETDDLSKKSFVHVVFDGQDSTRFGWSLNLVTPLQLIALAQFIEIFAKNTLLQDMQSEHIRKQQAPKIVRPGETGVVSADEARALWDTLDK